MIHSDRYNIVSISKGIAILLMVLVHAGLNNGCSNFIGMFHMPLFFFMAGYCFKDKYLVSFRVFIAKKFRGLYWPFVFWSLLFLLFHNVFFDLNIYDEVFEYHGVIQAKYNSIEFFRHGFLVVFTMTKFEQLLGGFWFVRELFLSSILCWMLIRSKYKLWYSVVFLMVFCMVFLFVDNIMTRLVSLTCLSSVFFLIGYYFKTRTLVVSNSIAFLFFVLVLVASCLMPTGMLVYKIFEVMPYVAIAIAGILLVCKISSWIENSEKFIYKVLVYIGDNSFVILALHFLCFKLVSFILISYYDLSIDRLAEFPVLVGFDSWYIILIYFLFGSFIPISLKMFYDMVKRRIYAFGLLS